MSVATAPLGEVAKIERTTVSPRQIADGEMYVGLENITSEGLFAEVSAVAAGQLRSNKFQFDEQHVLYGKLRPYLAKIAAPDFGGVCSTDILPIRPGPLVDKRYLLHYLRTPEMIAKATKLAVGINLPRLSPKTLADFPIPIPRVEEQRRIAAVLDAADALRGKRRQALAKLDSLTQALFIDMFGDPHRNEMQWPCSRLGEIADQVTDGEHITPPRSGSGVKLLSARNVRDGYLDLANVDYVDPRTYERLKRRCDPSEGDLLISCSGTIGRVARLDGAEPFSLVRSVALVRPSKAHVSPTYLEWYLRSQSLKRLMNRQANASSQANLFQKQIRAIPILLPPADRQREFEALATSVAGRKVLVQSARTVSDDLFASLQQRAFRGDL